MLKETGRKYLFGGSLVGTLALSGCLTTPQEAGRLFIKPVLTGDFSEWNKDGDMSLRNSNQGNGNSGSTYDPSQIKSSTEQQPDRFFFTFQSWQDLNGNGGADYPQEIFGVKDHFYSHEGAFFAGAYVPHCGKTTGFTSPILSVKFDLVDQATGKVKNTDIINLASLGRVSSFHAYSQALYPSKLGEGSYRALWHYKLVEFPDDRWLFLGSMPLTISGNTLSRN